MEETYKADTEFYDFFLMRRFFNLLVTVIMLTGTSAGKTLLTCA